MRNKLFYLLPVLITISINGQVGIGTSSPSLNSILDLTTTNKGVLLMRNNLTNTGSPAPLSAHVQGMITYNLANVNDVSEGLYQNNGTSWSAVSRDYPYGTISNSFATTDNNGWYLLNGRAVSSLPSNVQIRAISLGFATNLPNADDRIIKTKDTSETVGALSGNSSIVLSQANLPNVVFNGSTSTDGAHTHTYTDRGAGSSVNSGTGATNPIADDTSATFNTTTDGAHSHTVSFSSGGTFQPVNITPNYLITNVFIYLGN
ncbi:hypothetical protein [Chryseobacterium viscerum]|uniref:Phage tail collar domain-containing protein n=1 Tax=Chryseobacterium viscerum TaxID=1037377 RepID=A0A5N4BSL0_9FLAO|nr:hypothetical protein [Chryseobacterium viscerum]KAB1231411.1 hypothetical protein F8D52_06270 [Chryseobacterium viscerum]